MLSVGRGTWPAWTPNPGILYGNLMLTISLKGNGISGGWQNPFYIMRARFFILPVVREPRAIERINEFYYEESLTDTRAVLCVRLRCQAYTFHTFQNS